LSKLFVSTLPFGSISRAPLDLLDNAKIDYSINPLGHRLNESELIDLLEETEVLIAGTEPITENVIQNAKKLRFISRVGIGLDNIDLNCAKRNGILISYTPDAPSPAIAELTLGMILSLLRSIHLSNQALHEGQWQKYTGRRISELTIGIIGFGRIGSQVAKCLGGFGPPRILVNDQVHLEREKSLNGGMEWASQDRILREADVITIHVPLNSETRDMIRTEQLLKMKKNAIIINTSRGGVINEKDLAQVLKNGHLAGAALDVFENEPYSGELTTLANCLLTSHIGSLTEDCRIRMELEATEEAVRFMSGQTLLRPVPSVEYEIQERGK
jgi:D-3-phosphoglycerate dehydrogenase